MAEGQRHATRSLSGSRSISLDSGFPRRKTLMGSTRQVFRARANDVAASRQHFADTVCEICRTAPRRFCCPRKVWCGRRDLNPHGPFKPCGFSYRLRLSPPGRCAFEGSCQVCGLDYPFTLLRKIRSLGAARLVSTPSRLEYIAGLGSGLPFEVSPNLSSSASPVSLTSTQVFLKSAAYAIPPRPRAAVLLPLHNKAWLAF